MDSSLKSYPVVDFVLSRLALLGSYWGSSDSLFDIEQPLPHSPSASNDVRFVDPLVEKMPHLKDPKVIAEMAAVVSDIAKTRSLLRALGDRPDHETVDRAKEKVSEIDATLSNQLDEIVLSSRSADFETERREAAAMEKRMYKAIIQLDEMHSEYEKVLKEAEKRLMKIYDSVAAAREGKEVMESSGEGPSEEMSEEVVGILEQVEVGREIERVDLSGRKLRFLPVAFGGIRGLIMLNLSNNRLQVIHETIAGLEGLEELNLSCNLLESLPDSIGFLVNVKFINVSGNKLTALPDSISHCRSLVDLDASFNNLGYLPTNIGNEMMNLRRLSVHYNKLRSLPTSIGEMRSLQQLRAQFNELRGLPFSIGNLTNLVTLNLSGNFSDLTELPETFGRLINLRELDLSNNQIHKLPDNFGRLENLTKLNLEQNPIEIPPNEVVSQGIKVIMDFMAQRWHNKLGKEDNSTLKMKEETESGWVKRNLSRSTSWLKQQVSSASEYLGSPHSSDAYLNMQR